MKIKTIFSGVFLILFLLVIITPLSQASLIDNFFYKTAVFLGIIEITNANHLNSDKIVISDIYNEVRELDNIWSETIPSGDYVRVTFEKNLTNKNDITIFPRIILENPKIEIYEKNGDDLIAEFSSVNNKEYNKVYLSNLVGEQDTFDLKIVGGSVEFDHIIDPPAKIIDDSFSCDKTSIAIGETTLCTGQYDNSGDSFATTCNLRIENEGTTALSNTCGSNNLKISAIDTTGAILAFCSDTGAGTVNCINWPSTSDNQVIVWTIEGCVASTGNTLDTNTACSSTLNNNALDIEVTASDTCTCPGSGNNWEIDMGDSCDIISACDLGTGNITFIGTGTTIFNAAISTANLEYPVTSQVLNIGSNAIVTIG